MKAGSECDTQMTFRQFRDRVQWLALGGALVIVAGQWILHHYYVDRVAWVDRTPTAMNLLGLIATLLTLIVTLVIIPR